MENVDPLHEDALWHFFKGYPKTQESLELNKRLRPPNSLCLLKREAVRSFMLSRQQLNIEGFQHIIDKKLVFI